MNLLGFSDLSAPKMYATLSTLHAVLLLVRLHYQIGSDCSTVRLQMFSLGLLAEL